MPVSSKHEAWHPPLYEKADIRAIHAIALYATTGETPPSQSDCARLLHWLINTAAATYDEPFRPGNPDAVNYLLGRRSVGLALIKLMKLKPEIFDND